MRLKSLARDLEQLIEGHEALAGLAVEVLKDERLSIQDRGPLTASVRYGYEDTDLIPDEFPAYGLVDDLFVLGIGLKATLKAAGDPGAAYFDRTLGEETVKVLLTRMRDRFYGFWEYCRQQTTPFFGEVVASLAEGRGLLDEAVGPFEAEVADIASKTHGVKLEDMHVEQFLAQFRGFVTLDFDEE
ncbi:MAG: hypothetical protein ACYS22_14030 [Planctomycetota bacterium]